MAINLVKKLEEQMQQHHLKSVDPNTQAIGDENKQSAYDLYARAVMASALVGLYQFSRDESNIKEILAAKDLSGYPNRIFDNNFALLEEKIKDYSNYKVGDTKENFTEAISCLVGIVRGEVGNDARAAKDLLSDQRSNILSYLPGGLETGEMLADNTLDDRTNKMHGPFSDFTHWMEQIFSKSDK